MSDLPVLASDYEQTIDRQRTVIKALTEALENAAFALETCAHALPDNDSPRVWAKEARAIAYRAKELGDD